MALQQTNEAILAQLLDFQKEFPIQLFDQLVVSFYKTGKADYNQIIQMFQSHPDSWTRVAGIITTSSVPETKIIALGILETFIKTRWNQIPQQEKDGIRNFVVSLILDISKDLQQMAQQRALLAKLNVVLINIVKCEWPHNWPSFITDIVGSSKTSESVCINNMQILLLLSEEVFDYSKEQMTTEKVNLLRIQLNSEFKSIFELCDYVLRNVTQPVLLNTTLRTLLRFLRWIPLEFIYETTLIELLATRFFPAPLFQNNTLQCLNEIASLEYASKYNNQYDALYISMLHAVLSTTYAIIKPEVDLNQLYDDSKTAQQQFLSFLSSFLTSFLSKHLSILEASPEHHQTVLIPALMMVLRLTLIENDPAIFVICLEFWYGFLKDIFRTEHQTLQNQAAQSNGGLTMSGSLLFNVGGPSNSGSLGSGGFFASSPFSQNLQHQAIPRSQLYDQILQNLIQVILMRMVKPEEVLIVVDELGNANRERLDTTETTSNYNLMRDTISILTTIDSKRVMDSVCSQTQAIIRTCSTDWKPHTLNRLCWATGSISRALNETQEKKLLATILKALLGLVDMKQKKDDKAIVASNIMYIVGQYPRFMKLNYSFLTTVIGKLFHFMHEKHPGVQDMAVDTFLTIASKCKKTILQPQGQPGQQQRSFAYEILDKVKDHISDLTERGQLYTFYEAIATIISAEQDFGVRDQMLFQLMQLPNETWVNIVKQATSQQGQASGGLDVLKIQQNIELLDVALKTNTRVASAFKTGGFLAQFSRLFHEMLIIYRIYSAYINEQITQHGINITRTVIVRLMMSVRKEILMFINTVVTNASNAAGGSGNLNDVSSIEKNFLPHLINTILQDYCSASPAARDHTVITLFTSVYTLYKRGLKREIVMQIFGAIFPPTIQMLTTNFEDYNEHRKSLYYFLQISVEQYLWIILYSLQAPEIKLVLDSLFWGTKHLTRDIQEYSLLALESMLVQLTQSISTGSASHAQFNDINPLELCNQFYFQYLFIIIKEILTVLTDTFHRSSFPKHCSILGLVIQSLQSNKITVLLQPPAELVPPGSHIDNNNVNIVKFVMARLLLSAFSTVTQPQVEGFVNALFESCYDGNKFRKYVQDFLIELKEFAPYADELKQ